MERIISAACRATVNGEENVFPIHRHHQFYLWMKLLHCDYDKSKVETGFISWDEEKRIERFVDRQEAAQIALRANQILPQMMEEFNPNCLYSEDMW